MANTLRLQTACTITQSEEAITVLPGEVPIFNFSRFGTDGAAMISCNFFSAGCHTVQILIDGREDQAREKATELEELIRRIFAARAQFAAIRKNLQIFFAASEVENPYDAHHILTLTVS